MKIFQTQKISHLLERIEFSIRFGELHFSETLFFFFFFFPLDAYNTLSGKYSPQMSSLFKTSFLSFP